MIKTYNGIQKQFQTYNVQHTKSLKHTKTYKIVKQKPSIIQGSTNPLSKLMEQTKDPPVGKYKHFFIVSKVTK